MGFHISQSTPQRSSHPYRWVTQPQQFSGQSLDRVGLIDERHLSSKAEANAAPPRQRLLGRVLSSVQKLHLSWPHNTIERSQPTHQ